MRHRVLTLYALIGALFAGACDDPGAAPSPTPPSTVARFEVPAAGLPSRDTLPFPSDLFLTRDGSLDPGPLPTDQRDEARFVALRALLGARRGFCATCNVYIPLDGALDPASLPSDAPPGALASTRDSVMLADVDPASPERGRLFPLRTEWNASAHRLALRPVRGVALHRLRRYAAVITSRLHGANGAPVRASPLFATVRDSPSGGGAAAERARALVGPALDELARAGVDRGSVVSAAVFTTEDVTADLVAARAAVYGAPRPVAVVDHVYPTAERSLDDLLGVPSENRPGTDVPNAAGTPGTRAVVHATVANVVVGRFQSPRVLTGTGTDLGITLRDDAGRLRAGPLEDVPFVLIVPAGANLARLPVLVVHHGFASNRTAGFMVADTAGRAGVAVLAIDGYQHGARAPSAHDLVNQMRGDLAVPDGIEEADSGDVYSRIFAFAGTPSDMMVFPGYPLGAFTQFATDASATVRFAREGDLTAIHTAIPALASLAFDPDRVMYLGQSMGSVVGASVLTMEPRVAAVVLNVPPGALVEVLAEAVSFRSLTDTVLLPQLGVTERFDETTRHALFDPMVDLFRWAMEPVDPLALAPYYFRDPVVEGPRPDALWQLGSLDELAAPPATQSVLGAAGVPGAGSYDFVAVPEMAMPARENVMTPTGRVTAGAYLFAMASHGILANVHDPSHASPPLVPPFAVRATAATLTNPVARVHAQVEAFLRSRVTEGRATIVDPE